MKIAVIDNYDSFTYNLVHLVNSLNDDEAVVFRNDRLDLAELAGYDGIILSPGPGIPAEAGLLKEIISEYAGRIPIFGVCLGMQAIAEVFGGTLRNMSEVYHGVDTDIKVTDPSHRIFRDVPAVFKGGRYHSWIVDGNTLPSSLQITACDNEDNVMALKHKEYDVCGVQFHPESILTPMGKKILANWMGKETG
ncbi:MAG: aminodeoxychorismate/anthranilate synthase component II [Bacteroidales bacterium]|nr:aminodeoxychorismate/anthranilate synthase component II [Bacteroidales bacterium]